MTEKVSAERAREALRALLKDARAGLPYTAVVGRRQHDYHRDIADLENFIAQAAADPPLPDAGEKETP